MKKSPSQLRVRTCEDAYAFVRAVGLCYVFSEKKRDAPSLWDVVDLPDKQPGETGWSAKIVGVWRWKNELPATYPEEIFYGKTKGGRTVLMTVDFLKKDYYARFHRPVAQCSPLARRIYELVRVEPITTGELRRAIVQQDKSRRAAFTKALIELQVTLNIVRSNAPEVVVDTWLRFVELYPSVALQENATNQPG